jgi:hypothetical protein
VNCCVDDDLDSDLLLRLAQNQGHQLISPRAVQMRGARDAAHLAYAVRQGLPILSGNTGDFEALHDLTSALRGQHLGIRLVYGERDARRQMKAKHIAHALTQLEAKQVSLINALIVLNQYRGP